MTSNVVTDFNFIRSGTVRIFYSAFFIFFFLFPENSLSQNLNDEITSRFQLKNSIINNSGKEFSKEIEIVEFKMRKSPLKAAVYSAILPGAGQFYNESYWKIPIIAGLGGYFVYELIDNNKQYKDYRDLYLASITPENPFGNLQLRANRDHFRDQRDNFIIYSAILYIINVADAFVDAHLYDFDVSDEMRIGFFKKGKLMEIGLRF
jgi:hypothetical protein